MQFLQLAFPDGLAWGHLVAIAATVFAASFLQGVGGIGFAMVSAPIAVLFFPELVPGPLLLLGAAVAILGILREFDAIHWPAVFSLMTGRAIGTVAAGGVLLILSPTAFSVVFAILILSGVALSLVGWRIAANPVNMIVAGVASGLMGTITSSGGPPYAIVMQNEPARRTRATLSFVFFLGAVLSCLMLAFVDRFTMSQFWLGIILIPVITIGFIASGPLNRVLPREASRILLLLLSALGAIGILGNVAVGF